MRKKTIEEYIELIYILEQKDGHAHTGTIASEMDIKAPSVTQMLQKLEREGLVQYQSYTGATLTKKGKQWPCTFWKSTGSSGSSWNLSASMRRPQSGMPARSSIISALIRSGSSKSLLNFYSRTPN
jgi:Mn-dependent transcriptional regulator